MTLKIVILTTGAFFVTVHKGVVPRYASAKMRHESSCLGKIGPSGPRVSMFALSIGLLRLMKKCHVDPICGLLALFFANQTYLIIGFDTSRFRFIFEDSTVFNRWEFADQRRTSATPGAVPGLYWNKLIDDGMWVSFAEPV